MPFAKSSPSPSSERQPRRDALRIFRAALRAADAGAAIRRHVRLAGSKLSVDSRAYDLRRFDRIFVIGAGKASAAMALALEKLLGRRITGGLINVKYGHSAPLRRIEVNECGHPVPDDNGVRGARRIAGMARDADERDLVICVISGGASALLPLPAAGVTLRQKQDITRRLIACGASIHEINAVRKHLSAVKGGQLARLCQPATLISLLLSDVVGDDPDVIGSGPAVPDRSTVADAREVLARHRIPAPAALRTAAETPKPGDPIFDRVQNVIIASNRAALAAAAREARARGYRTLILSTMIEGETKEVARVHAAIAKEIVASGNPLRAPACVISGGETTVALGDHAGKGGRNQEFALSAAIDIAGLSSVVVLSAGTDGSDGPTDAAGALADGWTLQRSRSAGLDARGALSRHDSWNFFESLGDLIRTGPTGTNVMDVRILLVGRRGSVSG